MIDDNTRRRVAGDIAAIAAGWENLDRTHVGMILISLGYLTLLDHLGTTAACTLLENLAAKWRRGPIEHPAQLRVRLRRIMEDAAND